MDVIQSIFFCLFAVASYCEQSVMRSVVLSKPECGVK